MIIPHVHRLRVVQVYSVYILDFLESFFEAGISTFDGITSLGLLDRQYGSDVSSEFFDFDRQPMLSKCKPSFPNLQYVCISRGVISWLQPCSFPNVEGVTLISFIPHSDSILMWIIELFTACSRLRTLYVLSPKEGPAPSHVPPGLAAPLSLVKLALAGSKSSYDLRHLLYTIRFPALEYLELYNCHFKDHIPGQPSHPNDIIAFPRLRHLKLRECNPPTTIELLSALERIASGLSYLTISYTHGGNAGPTYYPDRIDLLISPYLPSSISIPQPICTHIFSTFSPKSSQI